MTRTNIIYVSSTFHVLSFIYFTIPSSILKFERNTLTHLQMAQQLLGTKGAFG